MRYSNDEATTATVPHHAIAIAGTGFSGIAAAIRLSQQGERDLVLFERSHDVGGTWRDNAYPGCACDVPSHLYSLSFAPNPSWTRAFSPQEEIYAYLRDVATEHGVTERVRFGHEVLHAGWDDDAQRWRIETSQGPYTADLFISAVGGLSDPQIPDLPGLERFAGTTFHSARWDHDHALAGRRVAVIGTGASAIQFVPEIQPEVGQLSVFQRTPPWIVPRRDRALKPWEHRLFRLFPPAQRVVRDAIYWGRELFLLPMVRPKLSERTKAFALGLLERQVPDPELRAKLTPDYTIGCKRILQSNRYLRTLTKENVEVVTDGIREIVADGIVTADGRHHAVDTIIFGTGFKVTDMPVMHRISGRDGRTLGEHWQGSPQAHLGTTVTGFPNLFFLLGPNTGLGHTSITVMIEAQLEQVTRAVRHLRRTGMATIEPRPEAQAAFVADVDRRGEGTVWTSGGCESWYIDATGRNSTLWPTFTFRFRRRLKQLRVSDYRFEAPRRSVEQRPGIGWDVDRELAQSLHGDDVERALVG